MIDVLEPVLLIDENLKRKQRAALAWGEQINERPEEQRDSRSWHYILLGETTVKNWKEKSACASERRNYAKLRLSSTARQEKLL